jgi:AcrR family transcriptional regulator
MARPRSDIRPRILRAARARFLADGVDGASLRTIARSARTNIGMIFYYFPTKDDLFLAVVEDIYAPLLADVSEILGKAGTLEERLRRMSVRLGSASDAELDVVRLVVREALLSGARFKRILSRFQRGHIPLLIGAFGEGIARGEVDADLPPAIALLCTLGITALPQVVRRVTGGAPPFDALPQPEALAETAVGILFRGVAAKRAKRRPA